MPDTAVYRQRLEAERARLLEDLHRFDVEVTESADDLDPTRGGVGNHMADDASIMFEEEKFVAAPKPMVVGKGLESIQAAMETTKRGVSARKVVVTL